MSDQTHTQAASDPAYDYIPQDVIEKLPVLYETDGQGDQAVAYIRLFTPDSGWTWYITEWDRNNLCFGLVDGLFLELGYFDINELREVRGPMGLPIERDLHFVPMTLGQVRAAIASGNL